MSFEATYPMPMPERPLRVRIEAVSPVVDGGRFPVKRIVGDEVSVEADLVADGHDAVSGMLRFRHESATSWVEVPLAPLGNDRFGARFVVGEVGLYLACIEAWPDRFATWRDGLEKKAAAHQDVSVDLLIGARLLAETASRAAGPDRDLLERARREITSEDRSLSERVAAALDPALVPACSRHPDRATASAHPVALRIRVDPPKARFSSWYELFPRSFGPPGQHGTFRHAERVLPYVATLGFDVLYLPPIHPIGRTHRKGRNNTLEALAGDPGSPWAIGSAEGGHTAIHPELGTFEDFERFRLEAARHGIELALDIAFQCSPDHPWVVQHPDWFERRPDGTIQYAENPPKKYEDIYPLDFDSSDWRGLWQALRDVFLFWIDKGVRIFRVDNPHTKSLPFWEWCLESIKERHPDAIFLSEAFTRPKLMYHLAKLGFSQSYTYFTWREHRAELAAYMHELTRGPVAEFFRPNFWPNTPDILPEHLQHGGRGAFVSRLVLAATLSSSYGIYGPAFELMEHVARPGSGEYLDNEKYQLKTWNLADPKSLAPLIRRINRIRRENPALQRNDGYAFHGCDDEALFCFSKRTPDFANVVLVAVCLDPHHRRGGFVHLDMDALGLSPDAEYTVRDLVGDGEYRWRGPHNYVELDPGVMPAHIFLIR